MGIFKTFFFVTLIFGAGVGFGQSDSLWSDAVNAYRHEKYPQSIELWQKWIKDEDPHLSSAAFYNLSAAYARTGDYGLSMLNLLQSADFNTNPAEILRELRQAKTIENKIGVKDGLTKNLGFVFYFLVNANVTAYLLSLGLWLLVASGSLWAWKKIKPVAAMPGMVIGLFFIALASSGWVNRAFFWDWGIVDTRAGGISLMKNPGDNPADKLVELPSGMVVNLTRNEANVKSSIKAGQKIRYAEINAPLSGWVPAHSITPFNTFGALVVNDESKPTPRVD
jgi:hypothetical protein